MRIDNALPAFYPQIPQTSAVERHSPPAQTAGLFRPGIVVDISPEGWAAYNNSKAAEGIGAAGKSGTLGFQECETCKNRTYKDVSDDPSVSFQTPTHISPNQAAAQVMAHENEHVTNEQARAERDGRRVISQSVTLESSICPECGRIYISGGVTRTVTADDNAADNAADNKNETSIADSGI